jgi:hypothetical protein
MEWLMAPVIAIGVASLWVTDRPMAPWASWASTSH